MRQGWVAWAAMLAGWLLAAGASASERVALVIGNASYQHTTTLANPVNDARDIAAALRKAGYAVEPVVENAGKAQLEAALAAFSEKAHGARQALVYYAGHGIEAAGENYLVPVDARLRNERTVSLEAVKLSDVMAVVSSAGQLGLIVLDACRDNPLAARMTRIDTTRSATRGFGPPGEPGGNLMVVYAAEAGRVAADGAGRNSPFSQAVLAALNAPPMDVRLFWGHVRDQVFRNTGGAQRPFTYGSLGGEAIYLSENGMPQANPALIPGANTGILVPTSQGGASLPKPSVTQTPDGRFELLQDGIRDNRQRVLWAVRDNGSNVGWREASEYCKTIGEGWDLPTVDQLLGIFDQSGVHSRKVSGVVIQPATSLLDLKNCCYWSHEQNGIEAFLVHLGRGFKLLLDFSVEGYARALCVRPVEEAPSASSAVEFVAAIYARYQSAGLDGEAPELGRFFSKNLDVLIDNSRETEHELDWDPLVGGQEFLVTDVNVMLNSTGPDGSVVITARINNFGESYSVDLEMTHEDNEWRIADIIFPDGNDRLTDRLSAPEKTDSFKPVEGFFERNSTVTDRGSNETTSQTALHEGFEKVDGENVLRDRATGLEWLRKDHGLSIWRTASAYCQRETLAGGGWRLPSMKELIDIYDRHKDESVSCGGATCRVSSLFTLTGPNFWSSTLEGDHLAWRFSLDDGFMAAYRINELSGRALCVRGPN
jgi:uncharacterized caspase-like protein